jgi:hypothetical protein
MWKASILPVLFVGASLFSVKAHADDGESVADVRCVIVAIQIGKMPGAAQQAAATMTALYYLGRLDGRSPKLDLEDLIAKEAVKMTSADFRSEAVRCGNALAEKGDVLQRIGNDLILGGKEMSEKQIAPSH